MKTKRLKVILAAASVFLSAQAMAQADHNGHGGGAHVCYEEDGKTIKSVEMYDLYEGSARYHLKDKAPVLASELEYLQYAYAEAEKNADLFLMPAGRAAFKARLEAAVGTVNSRISPTDGVLEPIADAIRVMHAENCAYQQLANWDKRTGQIHVKSSLYRWLDAKNKAIFKIHEAMYFLDRYYNDATDSDDARESTAVVFMGWEPNSLASVKVKVTKSKRLADGTTFVRPEWTSPRCYNFSDNAHPEWTVRFLHLEKYALPLMTAFESEDVFATNPDRKEERDLEKVSRYGGSFGNAFSKFDLHANWGSPFNRYGAIIKITNNTCGEEWQNEWKLDQKNPKRNFVFSIGQ